MALEKLGKIPSLVRKAGQSASKAQPFYSPVDEAIARITQGKGTGAQMLAELLKTKGVAKELKDRPAIKQALEQPKVTKQELEQVAAENPAAQIEEVTLGNGGNDRSLMIENRVAQDIDAIVYNPDDDFWFDELRRNYKNVGEMSSAERLDALERMMPRAEREREVRGAFESQMRQQVIDEIDSNVNFDDFSTTKFREYTIPGGENYREVLIKLPENRKKETWEWFDPDTQESKRGFATQQEAYDSRPNISSVVSRVEAADSPQNYRSSHFDEPNILAHARVTDRVGPNGEKILHVEEVQSDWHQAGRKKGYRGEEAKNAEREFKSYAEDLASKYGLNPEQNLAMYATMKRMQPDEVAKYEELQSAWANSKGGVPDAPFKQNWHELVMKRLLDDAARNGYDKVVITPGAKQAERYDLSKQVDKIVWNEKTGALAAQRSGGDTGTIKYENVASDKLADYIGKEAAQKLTNAPDYSGWRSIEGDDLKVGGEGMKGFYDKIIPSYLNEYGKRYGARVGTYNLPDPDVHHIPTIADIERGGVEMFGRADLTPEETLQVENAFRAQRSAETAIPLHSFDITPQMREEITTKGQPLYQVAPPVAIGAGAAMQEEEPTEYAGGGIIKKAGQIIGKAAQSSGMAPPVTATKNLTTLQDIHTSLGDRIRENALEAQKQMESFDYKYDKGQRVFTQDSAAKNKPPYTILSRTRVGNRPMTEDGTIMGKKIIDPETGKTKRTPYEPGYRVRYENGDDWSEFDIPATAIMGDVEMAGGGAVRKALKAAKMLMPQAEQEANLAKFLAESKAPMRLYHGTSAKDKSGEALKTLSGDDAPYRGGIQTFVTTKPKFASSYAEGEGGYVLPVYAQIKNPFDYRHQDAHFYARNFWQDNGGIDQFDADKIRDGLDLKPGGQLTEEQFVRAVKKGHWPALESPEFVEWLIGLGHDAIVTKEGNAINYGIVDPRKIKSAIGNEGTYDITNPDITKAKGGQVSKDAMWIALQNKQLRKKHGN